MSERKLKFEDGSYYHIYNRGIDKREIFLDKQDIQYFIDRIQDFNNIEIFGNANNLKYKGRRLTGISCKSNVVEIVAYAINPNHFHLILKQVRSDGNKKDKGISSFAQRVFTGYSMYFNKKYKRTGSLFQGKFKAGHIYNEGHLKELVAYVNLNFKVHKLDPNKHIIKTSYGEYLGINKGNKICWKDEVLEMFKNLKEFQKYTENKIIEITKERNILKKIDEKFDREEEIMTYRKFL